MNRGLDKMLVERFPLLYRERYWSPGKTCMCWGFPGDGWFPLIFDLSEKLEKLIQEQPGQGARAVQVKEKFGTLRFYMECETDEMFDLVQRAEDLSCVTCEDCGDAGTARRGGWIRTLCDRCKKQSDKEREDSYELSNLRREKLERDAKNGNP